MSVSETDGSRGASITAWLNIKLEDNLKRFEVRSAEFHHEVLTKLVNDPLDPQALEPLALEDLLLAYACSRGNTIALKIVDESFGQDFALIANKLRILEPQRSDARQQLWQRLFLGDGGIPKILEYHGTGQLRHWFRVLASRFLLNEIRSHKREHLVLESDHGDLGLVCERDPELSLLEKTYHQQFRVALHAAMRALTPEQRNALRCHYLHAMSVDRMADVFGVHRATAARRVAAARDDLLQLTRERLRQMLGADSEELNSVIRRAQAQSTMSVARLLAQCSETEMNKSVEPIS